MADGRASRLQALGARVLPRLRPRIGRRTAVGAALVLLLALAAGIEAAALADVRHRAEEAVATAAVAAARAPEAPREAALAALAAAGLPGAPDLDVDVGGDAATGVRTSLDLRLRVPSAVLGFAPLGLGWTIGARAAAETLGEAAVVRGGGLADADAPVGRVVLAGLYGLDPASADRVLAGLAGVGVPLDRILATAATGTASAATATESAPAAASADTVALDRLFTGLAADAGLERARRAFQVLAAAPAAARVVPVAALIDARLADGTARGLATARMTLPALDLLVGLGLRARSDPAAETDGAGEAFVFPVPDPSGDAAALDVAVRPSPDFLESPLVALVDVGTALALPRVDLAVAVPVGGSLLPGLDDGLVPFALRTGGGLARLDGVDCRATGTPERADLILSPGPFAWRVGGPSDEAAPADLVNEPGFVVRLSGSRSVPAPEPRGVGVPLDGAGAGRVGARGVVELRPALAGLAEATDIRVGMTAEAPAAARAAGEPRVRAAAASLLRDAAAPGGVAVSALAAALGLSPDRLEVAILATGCRGARPVALD